MAAGLVAVATLLGAACADRAGTPAARSRVDAATVPEDLGADATIPGQRLQLVSRRLLTAAGERSGARFARGERLRVSVLLAGVGVVAGRVRIHGALRVLRSDRGRGPAPGPGPLVLEDRPESLLVDRVLPPGRTAEAVEVGEEVNLPRATPAGAYVARLAIRDAQLGESLTAELPFEVDGPTAPPGPCPLTLVGVRPPPDEDLAPGQPLVIALEVAGLATRREASTTGPEARHTVAAALEAEVVDGAGKAQARHRAPLLREVLAFAPGLVPAVASVPLPAALHPGEHLLRLRVRDEIGGATVTFEHRFRLAPSGLGLYAVQVLGAQAVPRATALRGEPLVITAQVGGARPGQGYVIDLGLVGPDQGFHLVRKAAVTLAPATGVGLAARDVSLPLQVPEFGPAGRYAIKLRLRAEGGGAEASREIPLGVTGSPLAPLPTLRAADLVVRLGPGGPTVPGVILRAGAALHTEVVVGGMRLRKEAGYYHRVDLACTLRLRDRSGRAIAEQAGIGDVRRRFSFAPLRLRLQASWPLPAVRPGRYTFELEVLDQLSDQVSVIQRPVLLLPPR